MELHRFIQETLTQIVTGVSEAQANETIKRSTAAIAPISQGHDPDKLLIQVVDFDIEVTTQSEKQTEGGVGVFVGPVTLGSKGTSAKNSGALNRIRFSVPIYLPGQKIKRKKND